MTPLFFAEVVISGQARGLRFDGHHVWLGHNTIVPIMQISDSLFRLDGKVAPVIEGLRSGHWTSRCAEVWPTPAAVAICADVNAEGAEATASAIRGEGGRAESLELNILDEAAVAAAVQAMVEKHGTIDVLVSTPAVNVRKRLLNYTGDEFDKVIDLNLKGTFHVLKAVGQVMEGKKSGSIILFSSIRGILVEPGQSVYAATKSGLVQMARGLASELGPLGVRVNCIAPGAVETPLTAPIKNNPEWYDAYSGRGIRWAGGRRRTRWPAR